MLANLLNGADCPQRRQSSLIFRCSESPLTLFGEGLTIICGGRQPSTKYSARNEDALWYEKRPYVMDERPCDHEEDGVKV
jgi:hypothetical protein